jgi:chaperonin cofactor prefoldin
MTTAWATSFTPRKEVWRRRPRCATRAREMRQGSSTGSPEPDGEGPALDDNAPRVPEDGTAPDAARGPGRHGPQSTSLIRRLLLRHHGRSDGRRRQPMPLSVDEPVSTPTRDLLVTDFANRVVAVRKDCGEKIDRGEEILRRLRYDKRDIEERLEDVRERLRRAEKEKPSRTEPPEREPGDQYHDDAVARVRRIREYTRRIEKLTAERTRLEQRLRETERRAEETEARNESLRRLAIESEHQYAGVLVRERAIYDRALLRRHPLGDLVAPFLDNRVPRLETWRYALTDGKDDA